ncbi:MAG: hypothetical protein HC926_00250 [Synechococcaceae cyanobacterium SM2_3_60]|nr:hypothetical protein [Synechococcaceae cyanobacterium SM2_3_60]
MVHVDESGFELSTQRPYARRGQKVTGYRNGQKRPRTSLLAARLNKRLIAPLLFPGTCNTALFNLWLEHELCPLLNKTMVVILDNATFHKSKRTKRLD